MIPHGSEDLHNEGFELSLVDGKRTYDLLLDLLDPKLVKYKRGPIAA